MVIGSHNSMTFASPQWWMRPIAWTARCQSKSLSKQYAAGARMFDLRIVFKHVCDGTIPQFAHGLAIYDKSVWRTLTWLHNIVKNTKEPIYVRIINEHNKDFKQFKEFCQDIEGIYDKLIFFGGNNKKDWSKLYTFKHEDIVPQIIDKYSSCNHDKCEYEDGTETKHVNITGSWLDDICPWIYARLFNKKWRTKYQNEDVYLLQDFVGKY